MCFNKSSSQANPETNVTDTRQGIQATNGTAIALKSEEGDFGDISIGSDDVAQFAIESSTNALTETTDFLEKAYSNILTLTDRSLERADTNVRTQAQETNKLLSNISSTTEQKSFEFLKFITVAGASVAAIAFYMKNK